MRQFAVNSSCRMEKVIIIICMSIVVLKGQTIDLIPYSCNGQWGFCTNSGDVIIEAKYDSVCFFIDKTAVVQLNSKYGLIDKSDKLILEPKYDEIIRYNYSIPLVRARRGKKWKTYDQSGKRERKCSITSRKIGDCISINPKVDFARFYIYTANNKYGLKRFIKNDSSEIIKVIYDEPIYDEYVDLGVENVIAFRIAKKWNLFDCEGELLSKDHYDKIETTPIGRGNEIYYRVVRDGKVGLISQFGKEIIEPKYKSIEMLSEETYLNIGYWSKVELFRVQSVNQGYYYISKDGIEYICQ